MRRGLGSTLEIRAAQATDYLKKKKKKSLTVLSLLQQLSEPDTSVQKLLGGSVQVRTELSKGSDFTVLSQLQLHGTSHLRVRGNNKIKKTYNFKFHCSHFIIQKEGC